ncbi:YybH family protein [Luteimonas abyssi]|uniref:YybH family protein n=1 Tax=Luteimonas abyssi TaxID=1247514 RepID=UPI000737BE46|nr:nuclear transport factor 2 family protein [Luteimonas abyssi]
MTMATIGTGDSAAIEQTLRAAAADVEAGDVDRLMALFDEGNDVFLFDYSPPRLTTLAQLRQNFAASLDDIDEAMTCDYREIHTQILAPDAAWSWAIMHVAFRTRNGQAVDLVVRVTDIWRKREGHWRVVHEHASFPVDIATGVADLQSTS